MLTLYYRNARGQAGALAEFARLDTEQARRAHEAGLKLYHDRDCTRLYVPPVHDYDPSPDTEQAIIAEKFKAREKARRRVPCHTYGQPGTTRHKLLEAVAARGGQATTAQIREALQTDSKRCSQWLADACAYGALVRVAHGVYSLPNRKQR